MQSVMGNKENAIPGRKSTNTDVSAPQPMLSLKSADVLVISPPKRPLKSSKTSTVEVGKENPKDPVVSLKEHIQRVRAGLTSDDFNDLSSAFATTKKNSNATSMIIAPPMSTPADRPPAPLAAEKVSKKQQKQMKNSLKTKLNETTRQAAPSASTVRSSNNGTSSQAADDSWASKQEKGFTDWMNYTFAQSNSTSSDDLNDTSLDVTMSTMSKDDEVNNGFDVLLARREETRVRQQVMYVYHDDSFESIMKTLENEIDEDRIIIRDDKDLTSDLGLQEQILNHMFSYELPWLRLGLEVVFGKVIYLPMKYGNLKCASSCLKWKSAIKNFIYENMFTNYEITSKFTKQMLLKASAEKLMKSQLRKWFLKKYLGIVLIVDIARVNRIFSMPTVFVTNSATGVKSSKSMLLAFCKSFLKGEGDVLRHLGIMGYIVLFEQSFTDEFDYTVRNISTDLRDGVRLARLSEILTQSSDVCNELRVPAVSRLQKLHNVGAVFAKLSDTLGADGLVEPKHIVDGNRDKTLALLWKIMYGFELKLLINPDRVEKEVCAVEKNRSWRRSIYDEKEAEAFSVSVFTNANLAVKTGQVAVAIKGDKASIVNGHSVTNGHSPCDVQISTDSLLHWCDSVSGQYGVPVFDLTYCLADGRALCLLVHYYHPSILPVKAIKMTSRNLLNDKNKQAVTAGATVGAAGVTSQEMAKAIDNERRNFSLLRKACKAIGGIPLLLPSYDTKNIPEEKTMVVFLGYLFSRLIESSEQVRAAIRIQRNFRKVLPAIRANPTARTSTSEKKDIALSRKLARKALVVSEGLTDVPVTIAVSKKQSARHNAAAMIKRTFQVFSTKKAFCTLNSDEILAHNNPIPSATISGGGPATDESIVSASSICRSDIVDEDGAAPAAHISSLDVDRAVNAAVSAAELDSSVKIAEYEAKYSYEVESRARAEELAKSEAEGRLAAERRYESELSVLRDREAAARRAADEERVAAEDRMSHELALRIEQAKAEASLEARLQAEEEARVQLRREAAAMEEALRNEQLRLSAMEQQVLVEASKRRAAEERLLAMEQQEQEQVRRVEQARQRVILHCACAVKIQSFWRMCLARDKMIISQVSAMIIQSKMRAHAKRCQFKRVIVAISLLQASFRRQLCVRNLKDRFARASVIQAAYKKHLSSKKDLVTRSNERQRAFELQRYESLRHSSATIIRRLYLSRRPLLKAMKMCRGFRRLGAFYRAYVVRKSVSDVSILSAARKIKAADLAARADPSLRLGRLTASSLHTLQNGKMISQLLRACQTLELSTQVSRRCCESFATANASTILFGLIRSCNRSVAHQELLKNALVVLLNVGRHAHLAPLVASSEESTDVLVDLMQMFRDKRSVFCLSCELLCRLVVASEKTKSVCNSQEFRKRLDGMLHILERRLRLDARLKSVISSKPPGQRSPFSPLLLKGKGSYLANSEPLVCVQHLVSLLDAKA